MGEQKEILRVENLNISYKDNQTEELVIIKDGNFKINSGEIVLILGDNGVGKSSILNSLIDERLGTKELYFEGEKVKDINKFRQSIGFSNQEDYRDNLFERRAKEYIINYGKSALNNEGCEEYYEKLFNEYLQGNLRSRVDLNSVKLKKASGGQMKMISLLRTFSRHHSKLFILDEPLNNLDSQHARLLNDYLIDLTSQEDAPGILIVTHCRMFQKVDRAYLLENGKLTEQDYEPKSCFGVSNKQGYYLRRDNK